MPPLPPTFSTATFVYDGDGKRVKSIISNAGTTYFVGAHYEVNDGRVTKYYYAGSQRIALRASGHLSFLLGDHLGSTSLTTDANGLIASEMRYKAWGEVRYSSGLTPTQYQFTGQFSYASDFGLLFYNARWVDPQLGRFAQADSIVPGGVQGLDRYAYGNNSPIVYKDPSGHCSLSGHWMPDSDAACQWNASKLEIPQKVDDFFDIKDDPVELIARAILGEQAEKLFTNKEDDAVGVAWAIRNRYESGVYFKSIVTEPKQLLENTIGIGQLTVKYMA